MKQDDELQHTLAKFSPKLLKPRLSFTVQSA